LAHNQNAFYWVGGAFEVTALDPIRFYADVIYGAGAMSDRKADKRHGGSSTSAPSTPASMS